MPRLALTQDFLINAAGDPHLHCVPARTPWHRPFGARTGVHRTVICLANHAVLPAPPVICWICQSSIANLRVTEIKSKMRPERLELPTACSEDKCSVQLSYGRSFNSAVIIVYVAAKKSGWFRNGSCMHSVAFTISRRLARQQLT